MNGDADNDRAEPIGSDTDAGPDGPPDSAALPNGITVSGITVSDITVSGITVSGITIRRGNTLQAAAWKNGGGVTREIAVFPPGASTDTFLWRASVADVTTDGPFSEFAGIDRTILMLSGDGMVLKDPTGTQQTLRQPYLPAAFPGETAMFATLINGPTRDFNLMVRRALAWGTVEIWRNPGHGREFKAVTEDVALLYIACGTASLQLVDPSPASPPAAIDLGSEDSVQFSDTRTVPMGIFIGDDAVVLAVRLRTFPCTAAQATPP